MMKLFGSKNLVETRIGEIRTFGMKTIPEMIAAKAAKGSITEYEYANDCRVPFNTMVIAVLYGADIKKTDNGELVMKFGRPLPSTTQVAEIAEIVDTYNEVMDSQLYLDEDDMDIPAMDDNVGVLKMSKINTKTVRNRILGKDGTPAMLEYRINATDVIKMAAMAEALRKNQNIKKTLIIGGVVLTLVGVGTATYIIRKRRKDDDIVDANVIETTEEIPADNGADVDVDVPVVDIDDMGPASVEIA